MSKTEIKRCTCAHEFQDATYGAGRRVHNAKRMKDGKTVGWRCTVCTREREGATHPAARADLAVAGRGARTL